jgi:4-amino-4-deoxy-L-arabinose transferase-like glycosyltransferase
MCGGMLLYFISDQEKKPKYLYLAYVFIGLAVLAKGPVAIVLPGIALLIYIILTKRFNVKSILELKPFIGLAIVLIVAVPWYVLVHLKTDGAWTQGFFFDHNIDRFSSPKEGHGGSIFLPTVFTILTLLPFSVFIPQVVRFAYNKRKENIVLFSSIGVLVPVIFFSIASTKLPSYISPVFPFAALLIGSFLSEKSEKTPSIKFSAIFFFVLSLSIWLAVFQLLPKEKGMESLTNLHFYFIPLVVGSIVAVTFAFARKNYFSLLSIGFSFIITHQLFFYFAFPKVDTINPVSKTIGILENTETIVKYRRMNQAYPWALNRTIENYNDAEELDQLLKNKPETIILTRKRYLNELEDLNLVEISREIDIFDNSTTVILKKSN